jgi:3',5'-cyclic AMP phosphodiesterase CpdA
MFTLAHLSDPHLGPLPRARAMELAGKRLIGFLNWHARRGAAHRTEVLDIVVADMKQSAPDHIAVTGDLTNIALTEEFAPARAWLERLGPAANVTVVPGNHDAYVRATAGDASRMWDAYMRGDDGAGAGFPFVRKRGPIALIGLSTAVPTPPFFASGRLGPAQLAALAEVLPKLAGLFRVILIHHPPAGRRARHKQLTDATAFLDVVKTHGAELVLHGHDHVHSVEWLDGPARKIPAVGVPSASSSNNHSAAGYNLYRIAGDVPHWQCEMIARGYTASGVVEIARRPLIR